MENFNNESADIPGSVALREDPAHEIWTQEKHEAWIKERDKMVNPNSWQEQMLKEFMQGVGLKYQPPGNEEQ